MRSIRTTQSRCSFLKIGLKDFLEQHFFVSTWTPRCRSVSRLFVKLCYTLSSLHLHLFMGQPLGTRTPLVSNTYQVKLLAYANIVNIQWVKKQALLLLLGSCDECHATTKLQTTWTSFRFPVNSLESPLNVSQKTLQFSFKPT